MLSSASAINLPSGQKGYFHWGTLMPFLRACEKHGPVPQPLGIPLNLMPPSLQNHKPKDYNKLFWDNVEEKQKWKRGVSVFGPKFKKERT